MMDGRRYEEEEDVKKRDKSNDEKGNVIKSLINKTIETNTFGAARSLARSSRSSLYMRWRWNGCVEVER